MSVPSPQQALRGLGAVYGVAGPVDVPGTAELRGFGHYGRRLASIDLGFAVGGREVEVETSLSEQPVSVLVSVLVLRRRVAVGASSVRFPFRISVRREKIAIDVDGKQTEFTAYISARHALAVSRIGSRTVTIHCSLGLLRKITLRSVSAALLRESWGDDLVDDIVASAPISADSPPPQVKVVRRKTTVEALRTEIGQSIFEVVSRGVRPRPRDSAAWDGWSDQPRSLHLDYRAGHGSPFHLDTSTIDPGGKGQLQNVLIHALHYLPVNPRFPLDLTVSRNRIHISVDCEPVEFRVFSVAGRSRGVAVVDGVFVTIEAPSRRLSSLRLSRMSDEALRAWLRQTAYRSPPKPQ